MDEATIEGVHRGQRKWLAGATHLVGKFADTTEKILLFLLAIAFHVDDDIRSAFFIAVENAIEKIL